MPASSRARLVAVGSGLVLMAGGQLLLDDRQRPNFGLAYGLLLVGAIVAAGALPPLEKGKRAQPDAGEPEARTTTWSPPASSLAPHIFIAAFLFSGAALLALRRPELPAFAIVLWLLSLASFLLASWLKSPWPRGTSSAPSWYGPAIVASLLLALALRVYRFDEIPPFVHGDEAQFGVLARSVLDGDLRWALTVSGFLAHPSLGIQVHTLSMALFGDSLAGLRMGSVVVGALTVLLAAKLAQELFGHATAVLAALLAAFSHVLLHYGRIGLTTGQAPLVLALSVYLLFRAVRTGHPVWYATLGLALGLGAQTYWSALVAPVVVALLLLQGAATSPRWRSRAHWKGLGMALAAALLALAPLAAFYAANPQLLAERETRVFVFSPQAAPHVVGRYGAAGPPEILLRQAAITLAAFNRGDDVMTHYGWRGPLFDPVSAPLVLLGAAFALRQGPRLACLAPLFAIGAATVLGGVLTLDSPSYTRLMVVVLPGLLLAALAAWRLALLIHRAVPWALGSAAAVPLAGYLALTTFANVEGYFAIYAPSTRGHLHTEIARHMERMADGYRVIGLMGPDVSVWYETSQFLARGAEAQDLRDLAQAPPAPRRGEKGLSFLLFAERTDQLAALRRLYPAGSAIQHTLRGDTYFLEYRVEAGDS